MKFTCKKMFFQVIIALLFLIGFTASCVYAKAETVTNDYSKVQLYYDDIAYVYHGATSNTVYIKVNKNIENKQDVVLQYKTDSTKEGTWDEAHATLYKSLDANYSIYKANVSGFGGITYKIVVKTSSDEYVDDNNGNYYTNSDILGAANIVAKRSHGAYGNKIDIYVAVKNLAYAKNVKVRYTVDSWQSCKEVPLTYSYKTDNYEGWKATIDITGATYETFEYCLSYTVNGVTYWDNNFGDNYTLNHYSEY